MTLDNIVLISITHDELTLGAVYAIGKYDIIHSYIQCLWITKTVSLRLEKDNWTVKPAEYQVHIATSSQQM